MFYAGIDIAKNTHAAAVIDSNGKQLHKAISFSNSNDGCDKLLAMFERVGASADTLLVGMEATGHYWLSLYSALAQRGFNVAVINPIQTDALRRVYIHRDKTDAQDSLLIAQLLRFGEYQRSAVADEEIVALRQLSRYRLALVDSVGDCKRRVIALLDQVFPEYEGLFSDTFGVTSSELLLKYPTPEDLLAVSSRKLTTFLSKVSRGHFGESKAEQLRAAASSSFGVSFGRDVFAFQIRQLVEQMSFLERQLADLDAEISRQLAKSNTFITTIPGIGDTLGAAILGEIGDITRFDNPAKLVSYAGLNAKIRESGEFTGTRATISKRGSPYLRRAIWLAASRAAFCDPTLSAYYQSLKARGKHHLTAVTAVSRKMCNIIFAILTQNRPYTPEPPA
jgi:transposase